jgi:hypothetical protein
MHVARCLACLLLVLPIGIPRNPLTDAAQQPRQVTVKIGNREPDLFNPRRWLFSPEVVAGQEGPVRLARSMLIADEVGATDHHQMEALGERVWARKSLHVPDCDLALDNAAELFIYGLPREIRFDGQLLSTARKHESTGWTRVPLQPKTLQPRGSSARAGSKRHDVLMQGGGSVLFEPRQTPGQSSKSTDGGSTWSPEALGPRGASSGEYLVRLRVKRSASAGWVLSPVFDLWATTPGNVPGPAKLASVHADCQPFERRRADAEQGQLTLWFRSGATPSPTPDDQHWTPWHVLRRDYQPRAEAARHRWGQLRILLSSGEDGRAPEVPPSFELSWQLEPEFAAAGDAVIRTMNERRPALTSLSFVYQKPSPRLKLLREQYQLDKVIAPGKTEMEQLMLLRHWVRNQWHTAWGVHPAPWMPPWDALQILGCKDQPDCLTMCTHYACVFTQCCLALGWNARHCILDHHCTAEVFVDQHRKWVMMDAGNSKERPDCNLHFERNGVPLSALELHNAHREKKSEGIVVCFTPKLLMDAVAPLCRIAPAANAPGLSSSPRPETAPIAELKNYPVCGLENYRRYAFPGRNNYLDSLYPGELYHGWAEYFYDGYWWVGDDRDDPQLSPEYSKHLPPSRPQDIDWDLNWTRIHLCRTEKPNELRVDLETLTPNLERFERQVVKDGKEEWNPVGATFAWKLEPGENGLRVRSVNAWGRPGQEARVVVSARK